MILIFATWSCQDQIDTNKQPDVVDKPTEVVEDPTEIIEEQTHHIEIPTYLANTKWKLVGIVDAGTNTTKVLEPKDCDHCYTLTFTDSTAQGRSVANIVHFISLNPIQVQCGTYAGECFGEEECNVFCNVLSLVTSYAFDDNELKLYFNDKMNYLLFQQIEESVHPIIYIPAHLPSTKWKLESIVDVETNTIKVLEPTDREKCYTLTLYSNNKFIGYTSTNEIVGVFEAPTGNVRLLFKTEVVEIRDGSFYFQTLLSVQSFAQQENELRLYYNNEMNYLLYKAIE